MSESAVPLGQVLKAELDEIDNARAIRAAQHDDGRIFGGARKPAREPDVPVPGAEALPPAWQTKDTPWTDVIKRAHAANLTGLAFSGGGIRSAAFNLGVLQALAELKMLFRVDYLSVVSGGGYIGGWLTAWIKRRSFSAVQNCLDTSRVNQEDDNEPREIRSLRFFSNYLTPKVGIFSGDTLAAVAIILRNILLNMTILLATLTLLLLVPRAILRWVDPKFLSSVGVEAFVVLLLVIALVVIVVNLIDLDEGGRALLCPPAEPGKARWIRRAVEWSGPGFILLWVAGPLFGSAFLAAIRHRSILGAPIPFDMAIVTGAWLYPAIWLLATIVGWVFWLWLSRNSGAPDARSIFKGDRPVASVKSKSPFEKDSLLATFTMILSAAPAGALAGWLFAHFSNFSAGWSREKDLTVGVPIVLGIILLAGVLHIGLMGTTFRDSRREWWGRLGGWLLLYGLGWLALFSLALLPSASFVQDVLRHFKSEYLTAAKIVGTVVWIATTTAGLLGAAGNSSGKPDELSKKDWIVKAAPYVLLVGLFCWLSWAIELVHKQRFLQGAVNGKPFSIAVINMLAHGIANHRLFAAMAGCAAVAGLLAWRVDINQFSLHMLYRNRIVRCFLGASHQRSPNLFTGFDEKDDDLPIKELTVAKGYCGPYPVFNASLNLAKGQDLAWQERKAESFVMAPVYSGYDVWLEDQDSPLIHRARYSKNRSQPVNGDESEEYAYRRTDKYASERGGKGFMLGAAMAISGAAANPNMGYYTSMPVAFLLTLFDVRLGQWVPNPRKDTWSLRTTPAMGLGYLLSEMFAGTTDNSEYVQLSDGGHFDNMGLYELVKRRCGLIVVCDAEADPNYTFRGMADAIRKCRIDMGIDIDLDLQAIKPQKEGDPSAGSLAVGTIHYEQADMDAPAGKILYFKASLIQNEPADVIAYHASHPSFPHESTVDQWFSESQFEAYRELGYHNLRTSLGPLFAVQHRGGKDPVLTELRKIFAEFGLAPSARSELVHTP